MQSIKIEIHHIILIAGVLILFMGLAWQPFYILGGIFCLSAYCIDVIKRMKEEKV